MGKIPDEATLEENSMELGKRGPNPFGADNMKQALSNILVRQQAKGGKISTCFECIPSSTHNYIRFAPQDVDQLLTLHNWAMTYTMCLLIKKL